MDAYLQRAADAIELATRGMTPEQLRHHANGKWSSAEILEHLSRAFSSTTKLLQRHLDSGQPTIKRPTWAESSRTLMVIEAGHLPSGRRAPSFTIPTGMPAEEVLPRFRHELAAMDETIRQCEAKFGRKKIASHAIFGPLTARQWRRFHWVHTRHHARQIEQLRIRSRQT